MDSLDLSQSSNCDTALLRPKFLGPSHSGNRIFWDTPVMDFLLLLSYLRILRIHLEMDDSDTLGDAMVYSTWLHGDSTFTTSLFSHVPIVLVAWHPTRSCSPSSMMVGGWSSWFPWMSRSSKSHGFWSKPNRRRACRSFEYVSDYGDQVMLPCWLPCSN